MIMPSDPAYQQTKRMKIEGASPPSPFRELAEWIASHYGVTVLNVVYDTVIPNDRPRLNVILEWERDKSGFHDNIGNFDPIKQKLIQEQFESLLAEQRVERVNTARLLVVFSAFESVASIEANEKVTKQDLNHLKRRLNNPDLWEVSRLFDGATFFFYTDAQVASCEANGLTRAYAEEYARVIAPYDEFGYLARAGVHVTFDSKENFDTNYQSNWFYYYK